MKTAIAKSNRVTRFLRTTDNQHKWYLVDANGKTLGRLATEIAMRIRGKRNPQFTPNSDTGDWVVVINADKVSIAPRRAEQKVYLRHTGYPGGQRSTSFNEMMKKHPERVIQLAVRRMLPKNRLGRKLINKLKVYSGKNHPHSAQIPEILNIET